MLLTALLCVLNAGAFAQQGAAFTGLSAKVQRALARCLCLAAVGLLDGAQRQHYISHLLHSVAGQLLLPRLDARHGGVGGRGGVNAGAGLKELHLGEAQVAEERRGFPQS